MKTVTFEQVRNNSEVKIYIKTSDDSLQALGFTEHAFAYVGRTDGLEVYRLPPNE